MRATCANVRVGFSRFSEAASSSGLRVGAGGQPARGGHQGLKPAAALVS